jgi:hypothetical protein
MAASPRTVEQRMEACSGGNYGSGSSIIPVNIRVSFDRELVRRNGVYGDVVYANGVRPAARRPMPPASRSASTAESWGRSRRKCDPPHRFQRAPIEFASGLDRRRGDGAGGQPIDDTAQVGAPAGNRRTSTCTPRDSTTARSAARRWWCYQHIATGAARHFGIQRQAEQGNPSRCKSGRQREWPVRSLSRQSSARTVPIPVRMAS